MRQKKSDAWFLEPKSDALNETIAAELAAIGEGDSAGRSVRCADGKPHNLWPCSRESCTLFGASRKIGKDFEVFCSEGKGKPRNVSWLFKRQSHKLPKNGPHTIPIAT